MQTKQADLRRQVKQTIDRLSQDRLQTAADFLGYLEEVEATEELMRIPGALEAIQEGIKDVAAGRTTPVRNLRRKYRDVRRRAG